MRSDLVSLSHKFKNMGTKIEKHFEFADNVNNLTKIKLYNPEALNH